jgi:hypothetical protein
LRVAIPLQMSQKNEKRSPMVSESNVKYFSNFSISTKPDKPKIFEWEQKEDFNLEQLIFNEYNI